MQPAKAIITKLGGPSAVAVIVGVHRTRVSNWQRPRHKGGTNGLIPQKYHGTLLGYARANGIKLRAVEFVPSFDEPSREVGA